jgi:hypothetical protein
MEVLVTCAVEGIVDEAVMRRIVAHLGGEVSAVYGLRGKQALKKMIGAYNSAARFSPWIVLVDLDQESICPADLRDAWLPERASEMYLRVAVRAVESWLLADRDRVAQFLQVSPTIVTRAPDELADPKEHVVNLARRSRSRDIRESVAPRQGSGRTVGPGYAGRLIELSRERWRPEIAAESSPSLRRTLLRLQALMSKGT